MFDHEVEGMGGIGIGGIAGIGEIAGIGSSGGIPGIGLIGPPVAPFTHPTTAPRWSRMFPSWNLPRWRPVLPTTSVPETDAVTPPLRSRIVVSSSQAQTRPDLSWIGVKFPASLRGYYCTLLLYGQETRPVPSLEPAFDLVWS
jgi:hypothetical protein